MIFDYSRPPVCTHELVFFFVYTSPFKEAGKSMTGSDAFGIGGRGVRLEVQTPDEPAIAFSSILTY